MNYRPKPNPFEGLRNSPSSHNRGGLSYMTTWVVFPILFLHGSRTHRSTFGTETYVLRRRLIPSATRYLGRRKWTFLIAFALYSHRLTWFIPCQRIDNVHSIYYCARVWPASNIGRQSFYTLPHRIRRSKKNLFLFRFHLQWRRYRQGR